MNSNFFRKLSLSSVLVGALGGFVLGALVVGGLTSYLIAGAVSNTSTKEQFLGVAIEQVRDGMAKANQDKQSVSTYGQVVSIGGGVLVLKTTQLDGSKKDLTFSYDDSTLFVYLENDDASTEVRLSVDAIQPGESLNLTTNEPIGSVSNQHAVKVIRY